MVNILSSGTTLKNSSYRIQRLLGQGGFGAVYLAEDLIINKFCAIKENFDNSPGAQKQFDVEARILANLSHQHLPRVTDNFLETATGQQYLVMEYVEGQDLADLLEQSGPLPQDKVLAWLDQVLDAVAYLHTYQPRPVIHRDIKPANIRLLPDGKTAKLVDFGLAKIGGSSDKTRAAARGATDGFSPPEQYGTTGTDTYSDVYALGATLYALLTNVEPPVSTDLVISGARLDLPRKFNPLINPNVEQVILTAMQLDPKLRFPTAGEMRLALQGRRPTTILVACPHCNTQVRAAAKFCPACGQTIVRVAPFVFKKVNHPVNDIKELVSSCDSYWDEAIGYFRRGEFDVWLNQLGPAGQLLAAQSRALRAKYNDPSAALEELLEAAAPTRSRPILTANPAVLDVGALRAGDSKVLTVTLSNSGRGYLHGNLQAQPAWIQVHPANFGCLAGATQKIDIEIKATGLSGTELGVDYGGTVTILSNRGQQTVPVRVKVVDEPQACLDPVQVDLGTASWGNRVRGQITVANAGGGTLHSTLVASEPWITVDPAGQPFALGKGQSLPVVFTVNTDHFARRGRYSSQLTVQTKTRGNPATVVTIQVDVPYLLDPAQPATAVSTAVDLIAACDAHWEWGQHLLTVGRIEAFLRFIGEDALAQTAANARQRPDPTAGLETLLRAVGAEPPAKYNTNVDEVLSQLGFGVFSKLGRKPPVVTLLIENVSPRGYLHGRVDSLAAWLTASQPHFGCLPGQVAAIELCADHKVKKGGFFSMGTELFEIVVD